MKITVLNGSPKGRISITMQYIKYIQQTFPGNEMFIHEISHRIKLIEEERKEFDAVLSDIKKSDIIIWAFPLYYFLVPSQYKRFIELIFERKAEKFFRSKFCAVLTTSIHFFDHTAHNYMKAICDDLGMHFAGSLSASMDDLLTDEGRKNLKNFWRTVIETIEKKMPESRIYFPISKSKFVYKPGKMIEKEKVDFLSKKVLILHDSTGKATNLGKMVQRLQESFKSKPETVNIRDLKIKGGCLGCIHCGYDNQCIYGDSDSFYDFFEAKVKAADILFYCFETRDRYFSWQWKQFFDRSFYNNHMPVLKDKQMCFIVSGSIKERNALQGFLQAYPNLQQANLVDIITDDVNNSRGLDSDISIISKRAVALAESKYRSPSMFPVIAGWKIFRDKMWSHMRFPFIADNKYYKKHGFYDFPKRFTKQRLGNSLLSFMVRFPGFRNEVYKKRMKIEMIRPLQSVLKNKDV